MLNVCLVARFWQSHSAHLFDVRCWIWFYAYLCISWWNFDLWNLLLANYANCEWSVTPWVITMVKDNVKMIRSELDSMNLNRCIRTIPWQFGFSNESFQILMKIPAQIKFNDKNKSLSYWMHSTRNFRVFYIYFNKNGIQSCEMHKFSVNRRYIDIYLSWMDIDSGMKMSFLIGAAAMVDRTYWFHLSK